MVNQAHVRAAVDYIRSRTTVRPRIAVILGSGLGDFAKQIQAVARIASSHIPFYPRSTVAGHEGKLLFGSIVQSRRVSPPLLVFQGRVHYYESGNLKSVLFPLHVASQLGAKTLLITNAAGGINREFKPGDLMLIRDYLGLGVSQPEENSESLNQLTSRFEWPLSSRTLASQPFDEGLQNTIRKSALALRLVLREGTYCWLQGPTYETAAEIEMLRRVGVDAVGMSTVPEIAAAKRLGMKVAAISLISNMATGITGQMLSHKEVTETASMVKEEFSSLMRTVLIAC